LEQAKRPDAIRPDPVLCLREQPPLHVDLAHDDPRHDAHDQDCPDQRQDQDPQPGRQHAAQRAIEQVANGPERVAQPARQEGSAFRHQRSTSPMTMSKLPRITTASATLWPTVISLKQVRLMKLGARTLYR